MQFHELKPLWNYSKVDFFIWIFGFLAVMIFGIDLGLGIAVLGLIASIVFRKTQLENVEIRPVLKTEIFRAADRYTGHG